jgi:plastocyanin
MEESGMTRYSVLLVAAFLVLVAVPVAQARPARAAATVTVTEGKPTEFRFTLSVKSVPHGTVTFKITNKGALGHDFKVCTAPAKTAANACAGKGTGVLTSGSSTLKITFKKAGTYEYLCSVAGHAAAGMKGLLKVT